MTKSLENIKIELNEANVNIADILKKCAIGISLYSPLFGCCKYIGLVKSSDEDNSVIKVEIADGSTATFLYNGKYYDLPDSECMLFPSKYIRDWNSWKYEDHINMYSKMMVSDDMLDWKLRYYSKAGKCYKINMDVNGSDNDRKWKYTIPYDKFDPDDIQESLKFSI